MSDIEPSGTAATEDPAGEPAPVAEPAAPAEGAEKEPEEAAAPAGPTEQPPVLEPSAGAEPAAASGGADAAGAGAVDDSNGNKRKPEDDGERDLKRANNAEAAPAPTEETSEVMMLSKARVGKLIGKGGANIKHLQAQGGIQIKVDQNTTAEERVVTLIGVPAKVEATKKMISDLLDAPEPSVGAGPAPVAATTKKEIMCPMHIVGKIIGRGGETIRSLQTASGAHILINQHFPEGHPRQVELTGAPDAVERAHNMITDIISSEGAVTTGDIIAKYGAGDLKVVQSPKHMVGRVIGRSGETVKQLQKHFGVNIQIDQGAVPCTITISGPAPAVAGAAAAVTDLVEDRPSPFGGGAGPPDMRGGGFGGMPGYGGGYPGGGGGFPGYGGYAMPYPGYGGPPAYAGYGGPPGYGGPGAYGAAAPYGAPGAFGAPGYGAPGAGYGGPSTYGAPQTASPTAQPAQQYGQPDQQQQYGGAAAAQAPAPAGGSSQWQEVRDDQGRTYYFNSTTGASQWERPAGM